MSDWVKLKRGMLRRSLHKFQDGTLGGCIFYSCIISRAAAACIIRLKKRPSDWSTAVSAARRDGLHNFKDAILYSNLVKDT